MGTPEHELEKMYALLKAINKALGALQVRHNDAMRFLHKLHDRATGNDPLQEGYQTRLDADILEEIETILSLTNDNEETRPD